MAVKRKAADEADAPSRNKARTDMQSGNSLDASNVAMDSHGDDDAVNCTQDEVMGDTNDDGIMDHAQEDVANYTEAGKKRAESEAKRAWIYVCDFEDCGQRFNRPCRLEAHKLAHSQERPIDCPHDGCNATFRRKDHMQRHLKHHHAEPERNHACIWEGCDKKFSSKSRLARHMEVHESKFYCTDYPPCKEIFRKQKTLDAHIKTVHLQTKAFQCTHVDPDTGEQCPHGYKSENGLRRHIAKAHCDKEEHRFFCMECPTPGTECETIETANGGTMLIPKEPLSFATALELQTHEEQIHPSGPPTCSVCGQVFSMQGNLNQHFKTAHTVPEDQDQFQCPYDECGKIFNRKGNLKAHVIQVHECYYRFTCSAEVMRESKHPDLSGWDGENACGKKVKTKAALEQHIRTHHLGLPNRKVTRKLAKTRKKHLPELSALTLLTGVGYEDGRPITCLVPNCPNRFARDRDLKRHVIAEHDYTEADFEAGILERDAANGGQFWIGGIDDFDPMSTSASVDPSLPQTPMPYMGDQAMDIQGDFGKLGKDPSDLPRLDVSMFHFADAEMNLGGFPTGGGPQDDFHMDLLAPVQQYNSDVQG